MTIKVNKLIIRVETPIGVFGTDLLFNKGLNVIRAENSSGKSTCVNAIIYALGLDGMLTSRHEVPLPYAMKEKLEYEKDLYTKVIKSSVYLEVENDKEEIMTLKRDIKGGKDIHIITVYEYPYQKDINSKTSRDYFVRQPGSATRERGFHKRLTEFLNWDLPEVIKYNGRFTPLYIECIFPLMIVEQKRGWSAIQSNTPKQYSIKEVEKRAIEFLLKLDSYTLAIMRERKIAELKELKNDWKNGVKEAESLVRKINGKIMNVPFNLDTKAKLENASVSIYNNDDLLELNEILSREIQQFNRINAIELKNVKENREELLKSLSINEAEYYKLEQVSQEAVQKYEFEQEYLNSINNRINATMVDLRKYKDVEKIRKLGSLDEMEFTKGVCPTCHQVVEDSLLQQNTSINPMSIEENIKFLEEQKKTFEFVKNNSIRKLEEYALRLTSIRESVEKVRGNIRSIKSNLLSPENYLNEDLIREKVILQEKIKLKRDIMKEFELLIGNLEGIQSEFTLINNQLEGIPENLLSKNDEKKLRLVEKKFKNHVKEYGLSSIDASSLYISRDTYKPMHDGFDLESNLSASDLIRTIWAYLISLIEVKETNHLKVLILDEPKQHSADKKSFSSLLTKYSEIKNSQVIFATSESEEEIKNMLENIKCNFINISGRKILKRID
ncbi:hypothetical protein COF42_03375 [Bacillus wiedmannii]|uniref:AAA family ATPase n=1 Tax=Bacillus wiedmannii TaxID=1890302 RepID=UPI000BFE57B6|nr:AAA family ATPase [Bacillus wiedmannii]PHC91645.1 hypothetical protein COF42_03375 [Bacillus wiedmannii]